MKTNKEERRWLCMLNSGEFLNFDKLCGYMKYDEYYCIFMTHSHGDILAVIPKESISYTLNLPLKKVRSL